MPAAKQVKGKPYINWGKIPVLFTSAELSILLNEDEESVRRQLRGGLIPGAQKIGKQWFIERDTFQRHFAGDNAPPRISDTDATAIAALVASELIRVGIKP